MIPDWLRYIGYALLPVAPLMFINDTRHVLQRKVALYDYLFGCLALTYVLGVPLKFSLLGPDWLRFHLSDFGFPVFLAYAHSIRAETDGMPVLGVIANRRRALYVTLGLSIAYECFVGIMHATRGIDESLLVGNFDAIDVVLYVLGTVCALLVLRRWRLYVLVQRHSLDLTQESRRQAAAADAEARRRSVESGRRKPPRRPGRRRK